MSETPRLVKTPMPICGKQDIHGNTCILAPRHQRSRCSFRGYQPPWSGAQQLGPGTLAPPFTGLVADTSAKRVRQDRAELRRLRAKEK